MPNRLFLCVAFSFEGKVIEYIRIMLYLVSLGLCYFVFVCGPSNLSLRTQVHLCQTLHSDPRL